MFSIPYVKTSLSPSLNPVLSAVLINVLLNWSSGSIPLLKTKLPSKEYVFSSPGGNSKEKDVSLITLHSPFTSDSPSVVHSG